ncbi:DUF2637 domain-containing protein [Wenjunlia tyrosinilytica]|uniref:SpdA protein n=1 Tax=Wenjunlia tyrosinilytica TaxID=1544741 RepID=A0A917ZP29_9ACTN|nr:DUF2637 domain-containing protein [Wenjunlia tyrosinilytica]GGO86492.1 hypothetical protein GCM10012280_22740 [Wenjunlia tyrosinilytica]
MAAMTASPPNGAGHDRFTRHTITAVMAVIAALAFVFSFGNVWALALRLGIPQPIAPLVAPMVDLSVIGLLVALHHLSVRGVPEAELKPATRLMHLCGLLTLALNVAEPITAGHYGRAALDTVAPLLLLGWGKVGPALLRHLHASGTPAPEHVPATTRTTEPTPVPAQAPTSASAPDAAPMTAPDPLLKAARRIAAEHHDRHGQQITPAQLRTRLGVAPALADAVHAQLATG